MHRHLRPVKVGAHRSDPARRLGDALFPAERPVSQQLDVGNISIGFRRGLRRADMVDLGTNIRRR